ncbi:hypothetical protein LCGC14_2890110 [marine sediment metagenome]|uniref:Uncharacterized protein n=1 Tax=marine sediment metagenome TaxID=412755 RepID=A0A0F8XXG9_9ZZZZ
MMVGDLFKTEESIFNMAVEYLKEFNNSLKMCKFYSSKNDVDGWITWLRTAYRELSIKLNPEEMKSLAGDPTVKIDILTLTDEIIEDKEANLRMISYLINNPRFKITHKRTILYLEDALEIKIRKLAQKKGMLLPSKDDAMFAITRR